MFDWLLMGLKQEERELAGRLPSTYSEERERMARLQRVGDLATSFRSSVRGKQRCVGLIQHTFRMLITLQTGGSYIKITRLCIVTRSIDHNLPESTSPKPQITLITSFASAQPTSPGVTPSTAFEGAGRASIAASSG